MAPPYNIHNLPPEVVRGIAAYIGFLSECKDGEANQKDYFSCCLSRVEIVEILLQEIDPKSRMDRKSFEFGLRISCRRGHVEVVRSMVSSPNYCAHDCSVDLIKNACAVEDKEKAL
ncbi:hypothetical protein HDU97_009793 [Phlyctochytrium planicorne]|nr:hypothetical protein HDU97_009793 [Phlyctochytrium planicorne]